MGSALLNTETPDSTFAPSAECAGAGQNPAVLAASASALRLQAAERLAAHRNRRGHTQTRVEPEPSRPAATRSARIAAAVAERYAHTQSYRAFLAAEAERAVQQARAAAEIAARNAEAVAAAQQSLLDTFDQATLDHNATCEDTATGEPQIELRQGSQGHFQQEAPAGQSQPRPVELSLWPDLDAEPRSHHRTRSHHPAHEPRTATPASLTVRLYEDASSAAHIDLEGARRAADTPRANHRSERAWERNDPETRALDEEIAFRQAPVFEEPAGPPMPLPANLIEFPRQLVAPRKARPRLAEGPLRDEDNTVPADGQLRIFEVDPAQISTTPAADSAVDAESADPAPQWTSIWLDAAAAPATSEVPDPQAPSIASRSIPLPQVASIGRRMLAFAINGAIVFAGLLACAAVFVMVAARLLPWQPVAPQAALTLHAAVSRIYLQTGIQLSQLPAAIAVSGGALLLLYQALFFWFSTATPGMRCARIALCTFDDENPTRKAIRRRILAGLLSACPLGLGFLWATIDEERLAWHDRITRIYQRSY